MSSWSAPLLLKLNQRERDHMPDQDDRSSSILHACICTTFQDTAWFIWTWLVTSMGLRNCGYVVTVTVRWHVRPHHAGASSTPGSSPSLQLAQLRMRMWSLKDLRHPPTQAQVSLVSEKGMSSLTFEEQTCFLQLPEAAEYRIRDWTIAPHAFSTKDNV